MAEQSGIAQPGIGELVEKMRPEGLFPGGLLR